MKDDNAHTDLVVNLIGSFEPLDALIQHAQTNKTNYRILLPFLKKQTLTQQWYFIALSENLTLAEGKSIEPPKSFDETYITEIKTLIIKTALQGAEHAKRILQFALSKRFYTLIPILLEQKVNINSSVITQHTESYTSTREWHDIDIEVTRYRHYTITHTVSDVLWKSPIDLEQIYFFLRHGGKNIESGWYSHVLPALITQLKSIEQDSKSTVKLTRYRMAELLVYGYENRLLPAMDDLIVILRLSKQLHHPLIQCLETVYLINKLTDLIPSAFNLFADRRDIPVIQAALVKLNALLYKVNPEVISELEYLKYFLLTNAKKPPDKPGALFTLLCQLKKDQIIICNPNYQQEMKLIRPSIIQNSTV